ncbi:MAG TPA: penicillin acylase family protein [Longimicrobiales bacterium]|nr:penicillin acylase family protein [Longimicrobiales bacterium]
MRPRTYLARSLCALVLFLAPLAQASCGAADRLPANDVARWEARARRVTIIRDEWGIPHIYAPTDADAVFGLMYAQAEDDFPRIERNFLFSQGRLAEAEGESAIWQDLRMKLFIDPEEMKRLYAESPGWLRELMDAWADGLNYFLHTHPEVKPRVLTRFEPWMALTFTEGSIGGDIERVNVRELEAFYTNPPPPLTAVGEAGGAARAADSGDVGAAAIPAYASSLVEPDPEMEPLGSNGIAIAPQNTANGNALLLINPHTSFYFRHEAHVVSDEGLNAYGALTWGQFFVYQGFNEKAGWMHTSSQVDNIDEFLETVIERDGALYYRYGDEERPLRTREVVVRYRTEDGGMAERTFTAYHTHRGPIVRAVDGRWVSVALLQDPVNQLIQSYSRTKARNLDEFLEIMRLHTNSSNNTLFADAEGNIAYLHSNFVPRRDVRFDYSRPVDGSDPATDWQGVHTIEESPNAINPPTGFAFNTNNWPYSAAGAASPRAGDYPSYFDRGTENPRGVHALMLLEGRKDFTLESLRDAAYDTYLPAFAMMIPPLVRGWDALPDGNALKRATAEQIAVLRDWDFRWSVESVPTSLAVFWGTELLGRVQASAWRAGMDVYEYAATRTTAEERLDALVAASARLAQDFGDWRTPWGEINRFQRLSGDIDLSFDDDAPSIPVGFTSGRWGSLASFGAAPQRGTKRWYGTSGNSFVAVVEFGERVRALAITAGGLSNDPSSPHFLDQAERYATGDLRPVHFYREDVERAARRTYRPGER